MVSTRRSNRFAALAIETPSLGGQPDTAPSELNESFPLFPKLPLELQRLIWAFASSIIPQASPRIFRIAPDPKCWRNSLEYRMIDKSLDGSRLLICQDQPLSPPSLLLACHESRTAAYRYYVHWGVAYPKNFVPSGKVVYINKAYDRVYFPDKFFGSSWFLDLLQQPPRQETGSWRYEIETSALREYVDQLNGIQNIAIPWRRLLDLLSIRDHTLPWLQSLPSLRELTIIVGSTEKERRGKPVRFLPIAPGTVRAASTEKLSWWIGKCLETFPSKFPGRTIPRFLVATTSDEKSSSNNAEFSLKAYIDGLYEYSARPHFGPYVPDI